MAAQRIMAGSALLTATLLAAVLAIIAGILGMHVMAGTHSAHSAAAVPAAAPIMTTGVLATSGNPSGHPSPSSGDAALEELSASHGAASPAQCSCSGNCPSELSMTVACIPSAAAGVLAAPVPAEAPSITGPSLDSTLMVWNLWSYRPGGPSPGELSISRT
ncbi:hypothetical protein FHR86_003693 [Paenarthrobacter ilicis]|jgi:hypothetical protein|uniref:Uncharacterized protein n=2 Tax=Paenarthrobacter TaxID=1742992 RepID=A0ABX0TL74_9MICC|nr:MULTISPECIES: hypothetical protein [Paenarthrobacter]ABM10641.1 hypothetical protein AAur_pTC20027 [Paenarthrobacter aurescens TC1]NIJ03334.1 hypothetical protein [Paenarthrobacter ilicis]